MYNEIIVSKLNEINNKLDTFLKGKEEEKKAVELQLYTAEEIQAKYGVTYRTIRNWMKKGNLIQAGKIGAVTYYHDPKMDLIRATAEKLKNSVKK